MVIFLSLVLVVWSAICLLAMLGYAHNARIWDVQIAFGSISAYKDKQKGAKIIRRMLLVLLVLIGLLIYFW